MSDGVRRELLAIYRETDALLAGWSCEASTDCCHFGRTGREPELWDDEWALVRDAIAAAGGMQGVQKRLRLPQLDERRCPLLGDDGRCTIYASRPFGCRTFFCSRATGPTRRPPRAELAVLGRRIASLAEQRPNPEGPRRLTSLIARRK
jgi:Fe-S-cluster containining protein